MPLKPIPISFPVKGVHNRRALTDQPEATCPDARNVRLFDVEERGRGGQRPGTAKEFDNAVAGGVIIDELIVAEFVQDPTANISITPLFTDTFDAASPAETWADGDKLSQSAGTAPWDEYTGAGSASPVLRQDGSAIWEIEDFSGELVGEMVNTADRTIFLKAGLATVGSDYDLFCRTRGFTIGAGAPTLGFANIAALSAQPDQTGSTIAFRGRADFTQFLFWSTNFDYSIGDPGHNLFHRTGGANNLLTAVPNLVASTTLFPPADFPALWLEERIVVRGNTIERWLRLSTQTNFTMVAQVTGETTLAGFQKVGFYHLSANRGVALSKYEVGASRPAPYGRRKLIVFGFGGSQTWHGEAEVDSSLSQITAGGAGAPSAVSIEATQLFGRVYAVDGTLGTIIEGVDGGANGVPLDDPTAVDFQHTAWAAEVTANGAGTLPEGILGVTAYRGRIILYGDTADPNNWYASRVGDPLDWDFGADPFATSAFAADVSDFGRNPDVIFAMVPWHDDLMLIGGANSIRQVTGDPGLGGQIDVITDAIGMVGFRCWAIGRAGALYFVGHDGFYRYQIGASAGPENLSDGVLSLLDVDIGVNAVVVRYDPYDSGVYIWITPIAPGSDGIHVFYDEIGGGFWPLEYAEPDHQCYAAATLRGNSNEQQTVIMGCQDGFIRRHTRSENDDDGTAIASYIEYAPFFNGGGVNDGIIRELAGEFAQLDPGDIAWSLRAAQSAQQLEEEEFTGTRSGTWFGVNGGLRKIQRMSMRFAAGQLRLDHSDLGKTWAVERIWARLKEAGRRRRLDQS